MYPKCFNDLVDNLAKLPGVGNKTAIRYALKLLFNKTNLTNELIRNLDYCHRNINYCKNCGFICDGEICEICKDKQRDISKILVVSDIVDVVAIEKTNSYNGLYHVCHGNISTTKGISPNDLNIETLLKRIDDKTKEVILAISPTIEGEMTSLYIEKILKKHPIKISRLAYGIPMGANIDYADELTIIHALNNRKETN